MCLLNEIWGALRALPTFSGRSVRNHILVCNGESVTRSSELST